MAVLGLVLRGSGALSGMLVNIFFSAILWVCVDEFVADGNTMTDMVRVLRGTGLLRKWEDDGSGGGTVGLDLRQRRAYHFQVADGP